MKWGEAFTANSVTLRLILTEHNKYNSYTIKSNFSIVFDQRHLFGLIEQLTEHYLAERDGTILSDKLKILLFAIFTVLWYLANEHGKKHTIWIEQFEYFRKLGRPVIDA